MKLNENTTYIYIMEAGNREQEQKRYKDDNNNDEEQAEELGNVALTQTLK